VAAGGRKSGTCEAGFLYSLPAFLRACAACAMLISNSSSWAAEGTTAAGPIGGNDIRSAILPPPGLYGGITGLDSSVGQVNDGTGNPAPGLNAVNLRADVVAPFFLYVPDVKVFGGEVALFGLVPAGQECGQLVSAIPRRCVIGVGDPYVEADWSRFFGQVRPPSVTGAFPIYQGLSISVGLGAVLPIGDYNQQLQYQNGVTLGNNTWDVAPTVAVTYTTPPMIADGTEFSAKFYWDNYGTNPLTDYHASSLLDVDFAISEHIGRFQLGPAGTYAFQTGEDTQYGVVVPPDGRRFEYLALGGVVNYDLAEYGAAIRLKVLTTVVAQNSGVSNVIVLGFAKKLY
jgi:hypothetical protein